MRNLGDVARLAALAHIQTSHTGLGGAWDWFEEKFLRAADVAAEAGTELLGDTIYHRPPPPVVPYVAPDTPLFGLTRNQLLFGGVVVGALALYFASRGRQSA